MPKISVVVNTHNEEKNLERCLGSVRDFAQEIVVVDMHSTDRTVEIAKKFKAKIFQHDYTGYVEPARNYGLQKTGNEWIFVIDADEEAPKSLLKEIGTIADQNKLDYVFIPRKNIIFNKWIKYSGWWPDYNIRFFKKGRVAWSEKIHSPPSTFGKGSHIEAKEELALLHQNYQSISQYLERNNRYADIRAEELIKGNYQFSWEDLIRKPMGEFLSRYFVCEGYKDELHGLVLALLQASVEILIYLKVWEKANFREASIKNAPKVFDQALKDCYSWQAQKAGLLQKICFKIKSKI